MTEDRRDLRARRLLRLGSEAGPAGASGLRPGFMERLRARIESEKRQAAGAGGASGLGSAGWLDALGALARPALGLAFAVLILAGAFLLLSPLLPGGGGDDGDTLAALVEDDPALSALLGNEGSGVWSVIDTVGNGSGSEGGNR
jgi:hypothetical protein